MPRYKVRHRYFAIDNGQPIGPLHPDTEVEFDMPRAEWINRDSPGCLKLIRERKSSAPAAEPEAAVESEADTGDGREIEGVEVEFEGEPPAGPLPEVSADDPDTERTSPDPAEAPESESEPAKAPARRRGGRSRS